jgi:uncharacterized membrane protein YkoI
MKKKFSLQTMEMAEAAVKDASNFGLSASMEEKDGEISVAYESPAMCGDKETKAVSMEDVYAMVSSVAREYEYQLKWMREDMSYTRDTLYKHVNNGHIPAITDAGIMKKALKSLGLEDSYQVSTPTVFVQY